MAAAQSHTQLHREPFFSSISLMQLTTAHGKVCKYKSDLSVTLLFDLSQHRKNFLPVGNSIHSLLTVPSVATAHLEPAHPEWSRMEKVIGKPRNSAHVPGWDTAGCGAGHHTPYAKQEDIQTKRFNRSSAELHFSKIERFFVKSRTLIDSLRTSSLAFAVQGTTHFETRSPRWFASSRFSPSPGVTGTGYCESAHKRWPVLISAVISNTV